jgi:hypothetical protein
MGQPSSGKYQQGHHYSSTLIVAKYNYTISQFVKSLAITNQCFKKKAALAGKGGTIMYYRNGFLGLLIKKV